MNYFNIFWIQQFIQPIHDSNSKIPFSELFLSSEISARHDLWKLANLVSSALKPSRWNYSLSIDQSSVRSVLIFRKWTRVLHLPLLSSFIIPLAPSHPLPLPFVPFICLFRSLRPSVTTTTFLLFRSSNFRRVRDLTIRKVRRRICPKDKVN